MRAGVKFRVHKILPCPSSDLSGGMHFCHDIALGSEPPSKNCHFGPQHSGRAVGWGAPHVKKPGHAEGTLGVSCVRRNGGALSRRGPEETERNHGKTRSLGEGTLRVPCGSEEALCRNSRNLACDSWKKRLERGSPLFLKVLDRFPYKFVEFGTRRGFVS